MMNEHLESQTQPVTPEQDSCSDVVAQRLARFEAEVAAGHRDARTLVAIPPDMAKGATLTFPTDAFGPPKPW